ncbi:hypothetical protein SAMN05421504_11279 [Amycolatopsis xylanica]|uniref:DUF7711 domain-containing protein n=1 Tax=Amycolatopsis xylanica TaxID=589385 RepID=A0A1H3RXN6_9PSEU|nr:hypothetical protein [Amycolatopsis xylanica]SDZ30397.1 hypothetical protein SAMN05421504_11279 [Amycolatopsis xylanica]
MKRSTAIRHLRDLAEAAGSPAAGFALPVTELWAAGTLVGAPRDDVDHATVAVVVDLPVADVPWLTRPNGADHWANLTRVAKVPVRVLWRSAHAPVWNHEIDRPVLFWDRETGLADDILRALSDGRGEDVRLDAPSPEELRARIQADLEVSLNALRARTKAYEDRRWAPGKLTAVSDALWEASHGYFDLLDALSRARS